MMQMQPARSRGAGTWWSAFALFAYAAAFSFAYLHLSAGTGALLLIRCSAGHNDLLGLEKGERLRTLQVVGLLVAVIGLVALLLPGLSAPPLIPSLLMLSAGLAWGSYSLRGKGEQNPAAATAGNFLRAVPFAGVAGLIGLPWARVDSLGILYAVISGAVTSGLGYVIWYRVLPSLKATSAATVQLSVPVLAATGGILLLGEGVTLRYVVASLAVLGGIALVLFEKRPLAD